MQNLPADVQAYVIVLAFGVAAPLLIFWMLHPPLRNFLKEIFHSEPVEQFWIRLILVVLVSSGLSPAVGYSPSPAGASNFVALIWNLADQYHNVLDRILLSMLLIFLPLLLAYTILHAGQRSGAAAQSRES